MSKKLLLLLPLLLWIIAGDSFSDETWKAEVFNYSSKEVKYYQFSNEDFSFKVDEKVECSTIGDTEKKVLILTCADKKSEDFFISAILGCQGTNDTIVLNIIQKTNHHVTKDTNEPVLFTTHRVYLKCLK